MFISGFCAIFLYALTRSLSNEFAAFVGVVLYVSWLPMHQWNTLIYTESLFTNSVVISITLIHFSKPKLHDLTAVVLVLFPTFSRPKGVGFIIHVLAYCRYGQSSSIGGLAF